MVKVTIGTISAPRTCRLCLAPARIYIDILQNEAISLMLAALASIKIEPDDEISTVMCLKCRLNLNLAYTIQQRMQKAEQLFRQLQAAPEEGHQAADEFQSSDIDIKEEPVASPRTVSLVTAPRTDALPEPLAEDDYICIVCGKEFPTKHHLVKHQYFHKKANCPTCGKEVTATNLRAHLQTHDNNPHICDICGVTLKTKSNLRQHVYYSHSPARHKCEYCDKVYVKKGSRDSHQRKEHLGAADFVCDTCGKKFYKHKNLTTHVKMTHLKLRPYVCQFCKCGFSSNFAMKTHRRQHTNETPYRCEVCGEGFRQKVSLRSHRKSKHDIVEAETCRCPVCDKGFASKTALYTHQRVHI